MTPTPAPSIAIACGGTGGHLFPGLAVAQQLRQRGCDVTLLISLKQVDRQAVNTVTGLDWVALPAVGWSRGQAVPFVRGFLAAYRAAAQHFRARPPRAVLSMGGFVGAGPVLASRPFRARIYIHESNTAPGRANRWLARLADGVFVGFPQSAARFRHSRVTVTGTPVRAQFQPRDAVVCRVALGLEPDRPVLLVMGGSQGASGVNNLVLQSLPQLLRRWPDLQLLHLSGPHELDKVRQACSTLRLRAVVHSFFAEMDLALGAATVAVSRAGASSLAELAATRLPAILIPYPAAADNHQYLNARAFAESGAARLLEQSRASADDLVGAIAQLLEHTEARDKMRSALEQWHRPEAAGSIANAILSGLDRRADGRAETFQFEVSKPADSPRGSESVERRPSAVT
jgi:UDP-N-acetylglucosamine--N-acetylmuramyl-(pentapeptide) pyrophosphoryl-undecaprenol N-acetylglucosamine transferase